MDYNEIISNTEVFGIERAFKASKYPMATDLSKVNSDYTDRINSLATTDKGEGHDNFLLGIVVQFDLTFTVKAWTEEERYHFIDIISSQSTMHKISQFDLDKAYIHYTDDIIVNRMKELVAEYNADPTPEKYLTVLYSNPCGFRLTAGMTTNYRQLKTIYSQRKNHRLPEWKAFCKWIESLPYSELITGNR